MSVTTRPSRKNERQGQDYIFVSERKFDSMVGAAAFAEWATVFGFRYGTPYSGIKRALEKGHVLLCDVDVQGGMSIKRKLKDAVTVFLIPPSMAELKRRLYRRRADSREQMKLRMKTAVWELGFWGKYDYIVVNDVLKEAVDKVDKIIAAERTKTFRRREARFWDPARANLLGLRGTNRQC